MRLTFLFTGNHLLYNIVFPELFKSENDANRLFRRALIIPRNQPRVSEIKDQRSIYIRELGNSLRGEDII